MATVQIEPIVVHVEEELTSHQAVDGPRVLSLSGRLTSGAEGEPVIRIDVVLEDPAPGEQGWDPFSLFRLRQRVRTLLAAEDADLPGALIEFRPVTPDPDEAADEPGLVP